MPHPFPASEVNWQVREKKLCGVKLSAESRVFCWQCQSRSHCSAYDAVLALLQSHSGEEQRGRGERQGRVDQGRDAFSSESLPPQASGFSFDPEGSWYFSSSTQVTSCEWVTPQVRSSYLTPGCLLKRQRSPEFFSRPINFKLLRFGILLDRRGLSGHLTLVCT